MSDQEWEALCDGCGKCCLHKYEDEDSGELRYTNVACKLLDLTSCRCKNYRERQRWVPDCVRLRATDIASYSWLPSTCAYKLLAAGEDLPAWHPLRTGDSESPHRAGASVRGWVVSELSVDDPEQHLLNQPP